MTDAEQAAEFWRRRNRAGQVRFDSGKRHSTISISDRGTDLGSKTDFLTRGKVTSTLYVLPPIPAHRSDLLPRSTEGGAS